MTLSNPVVQDVAYRIGWMLVHSVWQATLVALMLAMVLRVGRAWSAAVRYVLCSAALITVVTAATFRIGTSISASLGSDNGPSTPMRQRRVSTISATAPGAPTCTCSGTPGNWR